MRGMREQRRGTDDLPRSAETTLKGILESERPEQGFRRLLRLRQSLNRHDLVAFSGAGKVDTRCDRCSIDQYRPRATSTLAAREFRAQKSKIITQHMDEPPAMRGIDLVLLAVDC